MKNSEYEAFLARNRALAAQGDEAAIARIETANILEQARLRRAAIARKKEQCEST